MSSLHRRTRPVHAVLTLLACAVFLVHTTIPAQTAPEKAAEAKHEDDGTAPEAMQAEPADLGTANEQVRAGDYATAEETLARLQVEHPDDPALLLMRGELLLALGRAAEALEVLERSAELDVERPRVHFQLGTARLAGDDREGALQAFGREIELNDDDQVLGLSHWNRSMIFEQLGQWDEAAQEIEAVLKIQPDRSDGYGDLAVLYLRGGKPAEALEALERGLEAGFRSGRHFYSVGARFFDDGRFEESIVAFGRAIEVEPDLASAERSLAASLDKLGRTDEALDHLRRYLALEPEADDAGPIAERLRAAGGN